MTEPEASEDLTDLRDMLDVKVLKLPVGGKAYVVSPCSAEAWLQLQEINSRATSATRAGRASAEVSAETGVTSLEMFKMALGDTFDELVKGGVSAPELEHCGITAYYWQLGQSEVAEAIWNSAGKASAPTATRTRPARASTRTSTGAGTTTRRRASGTGTSTRKK